ncbi:MAG: FapA family protein [Treponema sp.]|nr:FapA family protein [Treponema sp.]
MGILFIGLSGNQKEIALGPDTGGFTNFIVSVAMPENKEDGYMAVTFPEGDIEARADFFPPRGKGSPISDEYISALLAKLNIVHGIQWEAIREAVTACILNKRVVKDVLIARGDPPVNEVNEYFERNPNLVASYLPPDGQDQDHPRNARVDYREYSPFIIVKHNQALAKFHPRKVGQDGRNIHGAAVPYKSIKIDGVEGGENTRFDGQFLVAEINGQLVEVNKVMNVRDSLVIRGAVGYATGNIVFPGDVIIHGPVSDGFTIYSGGSVTIKQTFDVTDVITKADLNVAGGIIGRGRALVKVGGNLKTRFIDNCRVACRKSIIVDKEILNSKIFTMNTLEMGDKSIILGSEVYAIHGIRAGSIGRKSGKSSQIHCGVDFTLQQEQEKCNTRLRMLTAKLKKLRELMDALPAGGKSPERRIKMEQLKNRLEEEREKTSRRISGLMDTVMSDENAVIEVSGEIAPGTLIEICQIALFVTEPLKRVRIYLDKRQGKLVSKGL